MTDTHWRKWSLSYQKLFLPFARRRLFHPQDVEDVLQNFWEELMNGRAICRYAQQAEHQISLRSYCLGILHRRIIDRNRQFSRERQRLAAENPTIPPIPAIPRNTSWPSQPQTTWPAAWSTPP